MPAAEKKREAARYLLQNLERAMQANQEQMQAQAELEDKLAAAENECDRLRASLEQTLNNSNHEGKSMNTSANTLRAAKLVSRNQTVNTAAVPLAKRVEELEDLVTEHVEQASLQRVADLETACAASATAAADWEKKYKKLAGTNSN
jgi:chromosome segregation ATPase